MWVSVFFAMAMPWDNCHALAVFLTDERLWALKAYYKSRGKKKKTLIFPSSFYSFNNFHSSIIFGLQSMKHFNITDEKSASKVTLSKHHGWQYQN